MGDNSKIEWTEATWNPVTGCSKVSPGCAHCYAETLALGRLAGKRGYPGLPWTPENAEANVTVREDRLDQPLRWRRPRMVFVNSMSDLFHEEIPDDYIAQVFGVMANADHHIFQVLTKRPERMRELLNDGDWWGDVRHHAANAAEDPQFLGTPYLGESELDRIELEGVLPNVWLGVSIENRRYVSRADDLRATPAAIRFISAEPLLGPLLPDGAVGGGDDSSAGPSWRDWRDRRRDAYGCPVAGLDLTDVDWLIVGGESGPQHRRMDMEWVRALHLATRCSHCEGTGQRPGIGTCPPCAGTGAFCAFFFKQLGGTRSGSKLEELPTDLRVREMPVRRGGEDG